MVGVLFCIVQTYQLPQFCLYKFPNTIFCKQKTPRKDAISLIHQKKRSVASSYSHVRICRSRIWGCSLVPNGMCAVACIVSSYRSHCGPCDWNEDKHGGSLFDAEYLSTLSRQSEVGLPNEPCKRGEHAHNDVNVMGQSNVLSHY